jgi:hypothetical protein
MTKARDNATVPQNPRSTTKNVRTEAARTLADKARHGKPSGPVTYTIEKGANVWPGRSKT